MLTDLVVFISGPITGVKDYKERFAEAEAELRRQGHTVLNPTMLPEDLPDKAYMPICLAMLEQADAVCVLRGWSDSLGARTEVSYALRQKKIMIYEEDEKK